MASNWLAYIRGYITLFTAASSAMPARRGIRVLGLGLTDDNTNSILNKYLAAQVISGSGTWDQRSDKIHVIGSGSRTIALPDPLEPIAGQEVTIIDANDNANTGNITIDPAGSGVVRVSGSAAASTNVINARNGSSRLVWISAGVWVKV
jgi:hypothetical protein